MTEQERRLNVIRSICGAYYRGRCAGDCPQCLDRFLEKNQDDREETNV